MSFSIALRQGPARMASALPRMQPKFTSTMIRSFHSAPTSRSTTLLSSAAARNAFSRTGPRRLYNNSGIPVQQEAPGSGIRKLLVGGAIFGGTLFAINVVFNRETRDD